MTFLKNLTPNHSSLQPCCWRKSNGVVLDEVTRVKVTTEAKRDEKTVSANGMRRMECNTRDIYTIVNSIGTMDWMQISPNMEKIRFRLTIHLIVRFVRKRRVKVCPAKQTEHNELGSIETAKYAIINAVLQKKKTGFIVSCTTHVTGKNPAPLSPLVFSISWPIVPLICCTNSNVQ